MASPSQMPKTVKIGAHTYNILRKPASILEDNLGHCDSNALQIWVRARLRKSKAQEILLHEILHAIILQSLMGEEKYDDEEFIVATAPVLLQVLQENPELLTFLAR
jgi:hypothetical protein